MAAALVHQQKERRPEAARRERVAVGRVRGRDFGSDRPPAGPDLGRNGCRTAQATARIKTSRSSLWRFLDRHNITLKKKCCKQPNGSEQMWRERAAAGYESKGMLDPARLVFIDETAVSTNMVRLRGASPRVASG